MPTVSESTAALQPIPDSEETEQEMLDRVFDAPDPGKAASSRDPLLPRSEPRPRVVQVKREMESQASVPGKDWSAWDLGRSMQLLRSQNSAVVRRTLRMLHIRWWHASAKRMYDILNSTGVSLSMSLIQEIVDTCRPCRMWARTSPSAAATIRHLTKFNECAQHDLTFFESKPIQHIICAFTRLSQACWLPGKTTLAPLEGIDKSGSGHMDPWTHWSLTKNPA